MSWHWLLIECPFAFSATFEPRVAGEPARYGSAFHDIEARALTEQREPRATWIAPVADKWGVGQYTPDLFKHTIAGWNTLTDWLRGRNPFNINFYANGNTHIIEKAIALTPGVSARWIEPHDADHVYHGLEAGEQPGTLDLAVIPPKRLLRKQPVLVEDHKTGEEDFSRPLDKAQLLSLAAAVMRVTGATEAIVAVLHARRWGLPKVYADRVKLSELGNYEKRLTTSIARIGDGSMRPGPWCGRCPARDVCPAKDSELLTRAGDVLTGLTAAGGALSNGGVTGKDLAIRSKAVMSVEKKMGLLYSVVKKAEIMAGRARDEIKKAIIASGGRLVPETPDGEVLIVREYEKENLSKSGVIEAYGKTKGEKMLSRLRADGAITKTKVQQLWPDKGRGRAG